MIGSFKPAADGPRPLAVVHLDTERGWRGGQRQVLLLAGQLSVWGQRSIVAARGGGPLYAAASEAGLAVIPAEPLFEMDPLAAWSLRSFLIREKVDVLHAHTGHAVAQGALATLGTGTTLVTTRRVDIAPSNNAVSRWKYRRARAVIAVSRAVRDVMVRWGVAAERVWLVHSGVALGEAREGEHPGLPGVAGLRADVPLVVMVAALAGQKSPVTFVRAVAVALQLGAELQGVLVGDGPLLDGVRREAAALSLGKAFLTLGWRQDAEAFIAAADVVVLSSREEGLGSVLLDAMRFGKPVAATAAGGIPEVVEDGVTGLLVPVGDSDALGAAIAKLCKDDKLRTRMGSAARERVIQYSAERMAGGTLEVYRRVLGLAGPALEGTRR